MTKNATISFTIQPIRRPMNDPFRRRLYWGIVDVRRLAIDCWLAALAAAVEGRGAANCRPLLPRLSLPGSASFFQGG